jgi:glucosamine-phosphate N-acetyltransferase
MEKIRQLNEEDYEEYHQLINEFRPTNFTQYEFTTTLYEIKPNTEIWIIEKENNIIATGTMLYERKFIHNIGVIGHIEDVCVSKSQRNSGLGKKMIDHLLQQGIQKGCYKIILDCSEENQPFYAKCGLEKKGIQMAYYVTEK